MLKCVVDGGDAIVIHRISSPPQTTLVAIVILANVRFLRRILDYHRT